MGNSDRPSIDQTSISFLISTEIILFGCEIPTFAGGRKFAIYKKPSVHTLTTYRKRLWGLIYIRIPPY